MLHLFLSNDLHEMLLKLGIPLDFQHDIRPWNWHAKIIKFARTKYVLVVEEDTRYAVVLPDFKKKEFQNFHNILTEQLVAHLYILFSNQSAKNIDKLREFIKTLPSECSYAKPISRSIIAHMTQMQNEIEIFCHKNLEGFLPANARQLWALNCYLNERIRKLPEMNDYAVPIEEFRRKMFSMLDFEQTDNIIELDLYRK
jgi:hypothetical protein